MIAISLFSLRVLPHLQDTGGFFVAVLEKTDWLPWQLEASSKKQSQVDAPADAITTVEEEITKEEDKKEESVSKDVGQCKRPDDILGKYVACIGMVDFTIVGVHKEVGGS